MEGRTPHTQSPRYPNNQKPVTINPNQPPYPIDGLLLIDKPPDHTSHDVVARIRRHFQFKKVGHGGTLDPLATGLLIILLGRGTKLSNFVMSSDKVYEGTMRLGISTDSQDVAGKIIRETDSSGVTEEAIRSACKDRTGDILQTPPMVSAIKKDGVPLYKLARKGMTVEREPRLIHVYRFEILSFQPPCVNFRIQCTKGTYVRTLVSDIGDALGCGAHLGGLRRTQSGNFHIEDSITLEEALSTSPEELAKRIIPPARVQTIGPQNP